MLHDGDPPRWTAGLTVSEKWESLETLGDVIRRLAEHPSPPAAALKELTLPDLTGSL